MKTMKELISLLRNSGDESNMFASHSDNALLIILIKMLSSKCKLWLQLIK